jgi:hypothetical protein
MPDEPNNVMETPLERASQDVNDPTAQLEHDDAESHELIEDIDAFVAHTDPDSLFAAEEQLNSWKTPRDIATSAPADSQGKLVSVFPAQSESEANIIAGILNSEGIPAMFDNLHAPILGEALTSSKSCWADILVPEAMAEAARTVIAEAQH